jgi:hypothetical protein
MFASNRRWTIFVKWSDSKRRYIPWDLFRLSLRMKETWKNFPG